LYKTEKIKDKEQKQRERVKTKKKEVKRTRAQKSLTTWLEKDRKTEKREIVRVTISIFYMANLIFKKRSIKKCDI
jgi:hypothetical protein